MQLQVSSNNRRTLCMTQGNTAKWIVAACAETPQLDLSALTRHLRPFKGRIPPAERMFMLRAHSLQACGASLSRWRQIVDGADTRAVSRWASSWVHELGSTLDGRRRFEIWQTGERHIHCKHLIGDFFLTMSISSNQPINGDVLQPLRGARLVTLKRRHKHARLLYQMCLSDCTHPF